jgi:histidinol-phosphate aminotransferase
LEKNDNVVILSPTYDNFRLFCEAAGTKVNPFFYDEDFVFDLKKFQQFLRYMQPKLVYIANPNNPTGTLISPPEIEVLLKNYTETLFVIDEAYFEFSGDSCASFVTKYSNIIVTRTFSKAFALASFRIGYVLAHAEVLSCLNKIRNIKSVSSLSQVAAIAALGDLPYTRKYILEIQQAKQNFIKGLSACPVACKIYSKYGNFILIQFKEKLGKERFINLLSQNCIFIRDLSHLSHLSNCVRITIGTKKQMEYVMEVITKNISINEK